MFTSRLNHVESMHVHIVCLCSALLSCFGNQFVTPDINNVVGSIVGGVFGHFPACDENYHMFFLTVTVFQLTETW